MNFKNILFLILILAPLFSYSQKYQTATLTYENGTTNKKRIFIDYNKNKILSPQETIDFQNIINIQIKDRTYTKIKKGQKEYFAYPLTEGKGSLFDISGYRYLVKGKEDDVFKVLDIKNNKSKITGIMSVLLNDCNELRDFLKKQISYDEEDLIETINKYNNCEYSDFKPTQAEIKTANINRKEKISVYVGASIGFNSVKFEEDNDTENIGSTQIHFGVTGFPNFSGTPNKKLSFNGELILSIGNEKDLQTIQQVDIFKINSFRFLIGTEYYITNTDKFKPFIGLNAGISSDSYSGTFVTSTEIDTQRANFIYGFKVGSKFSIGKSQLGLILNYFPEYESNPEETVVANNLNVFNTTCTIGLNYYF